MRKPKDKPRVERTVRFVREDCFAGERIGDVDQAREHALHWSREESGMRRHSTTGRLPREHFEQVEQGQLKPAPLAPYDVPRWSRPRVQRDQHAQVDRALYSLPADYAGVQLDARQDLQTVRFYLRGVVVKAHARVEPHKRSTDPADFDANRFATAQRDVAFFLAKARELGEWTGKYAEALLASELPWTRMRQVHALLRLPQRYGQERVERGCRTALEVELVNVARLERVIQQWAPVAEPTQRPRGELIAFGKYQRPAKTYSLRRAINHPATDQEGRT